MTNLHHFDELYANDADPFGYTHRFYEQRKREIALACLVRARYRRCFEPGCSIGTLTARLATRCDEVVAADAAAAAVEAARRATAALDGVTVERLEVPKQWPSGTFDLIVVSELGYYLDERGLELLFARCESSIAPGGHLLAVHWLGEADDFALPGGARAVHAALAARPAFARLVAHRDTAFLLDLVERR